MRVDELKTKLAIEDSVAAERERCASLVDDLAGALKENGWDNAPIMMAVAATAKMIRDGSR